MANDYETELEEFQRVLEGTLAYLRAQAANELTYRQMMRMERRAYHQANSMLAKLGVYEASGEPAQATDELLSAAMGDSDDQAAAVLVEPDVEPMDEGPEGVDDDEFQEVSEEAERDEPDPVDDLDIEGIDLDDDPTAEPGTQTPMPAEPRRDDDDLEEIDIDDLEIDDLDYSDDSDAETGEVERPAAITVEPPRPKPLLPDFDFDDDSDEEDATVVFAIGPGQADIAALLEEEAGASAGSEVELVEEEIPESFDLLTDGVATEDDMDADEPEPEPIEEPEDDGPAPLDLGSSAPAAVSTRAAPSPQVAAGLYGNPNEPTIREGGRPSAAAVQISAGGGGVSARGTGGPAFEEEEEVLEIGAIEDYEEDYEEDEDSESSVGGGFKLDIQEYEEEYEEEEEEEEPEPEPIPVPKGPSRKQIEAALNAAQRSTEQGNMRAGVDLFSDVIDADPDNIDAYVGRGRLFLDLGDYTRAMSDFMVAEEIDDNSPEPQVAIGDLHFARKDYRKAIDYFDEALRLSPDHAMAFCRRGISHYYRKNYTDALDDLRKAESLNEDIPNIGTYISMAKKKAKRS